MEKVLVFKNCEKIDYCTYKYKTFDGGHNIFTISVTKGFELHGWRKNEAGFDEYSKLVADYLFDDDYRSFFFKGSKCLIEVKISKDIKTATLKVVYIGKLVEFFEKVV